MIVVYTGEGKGKTSAAMGQMVRALGHDLRVGCAQFMKRDEVAGEQAFWRNRLGQDLYIGGLGFFRNQAELPKHRQAALRTLEWALGRIRQGVQVLVLDEILYALGAGLVEQEELLALLDEAKAREVHLILTGRGLPDWLRRPADLITEMTPRKHPFDQGQGAMLGIDY